MPKPSIYIAAPLFNPRELAFNRKIAAQIEAAGIEAFLPQRDGSLLAHMLKSGLPREVAERRIFEQDTAALKRAHGLVAVLDGAVVDDGVAFEIGYAYAIGCECVGFQSDVRRALPSGNNPMLGGAIQTILSSHEELEAWIHDFGVRWSARRAIA